MRDVSAWLWDSVDEERVWHEDVRLRELNEFCGVLPNARRVCKNCFFLLLSWRSKRGLLLSPGCLRTAGHSVNRKTQIYYERENFECF